MGTDATFTVELLGLQEGGTGGQEPSALLASHDQNQCSGYGWLDDGLLGLVMTSPCICIMDIDSPFGSLSIILGHGHAHAREGDEGSPSAGWTLDAGPVDVAMATMHKQCKS